ncbi:hypothetical protein HNP73_004029 [Amaricoccus macauensis]|uniref:Uncharacterized protein n=1 Tax=Amaricoccus macauensis TaxID=57001 RepID=A0A840STT7_9RHOB|nr:hypothetical protein [Amaricoccus macauensis]MBB5224068.1 hypothetical protein [Amaricoccus macauensis]
MAAPDPGEPDRGRKVSIGFMALWLIVWCAAIFIAIWAFGGAAWSGDIGAAIFLVIWVIGACFGLASGIRRLVGLSMGEPVTKRRLRPNDWNDGMHLPERENRQEPDRGGDGR